MGRSFNPGDLILYCIKSPNLYPGLIVKSYPLEFYDIYCYRKEMLIKGIELKRVKNFMPSETGGRPENCARMAALKNLKI